MHGSMMPIIYAKETDVSKYTMSVSQALMFCITDAVADKIRK